MNLFRNLRTLIKNLSGKKRADRLDGPPSTEYGFAPHAAAYLASNGQSSHDTLPEGHERWSNITNVTNLATLPAAPHPVQGCNFDPAGREQQSSLNELFLSDFNPNAACGSQAASDPYSFPDMREALPEIGEPAASPVPRLEANAGVSSHGDGTYGSRNMEQGRLGIKGQVLGRWECEHVLGVSVVHPGVDRRSPEGSRLEAAMPAYYEGMHLHQEHAGSGYGNRILDPNVHGGWKTSNDFRKDQRQTLRDPVAAREGTSASNGYQLTKLGYAHILRAEEKGLSKPHSVPDYLAESGRNQPRLPCAYYVKSQEAIATDSYNNMVMRDPPISHRLNGKDESVSLGPQGRAEALLAREAVVSGQWPDHQRVASISHAVLPPPAYSEKVDIWKAMDAEAKRSPPAYDVRDRGQPNGR